MLHKPPKDTPNKPTIDRYRLLHFLSRGENKSVYQAVDIHTARPVALKLVRLDQGQEEKQQRFQHFRNIMEEVTTLDHPHILPVLDFGEMTNGQGEREYGYAYTVMPLATERSLDIWLSNYWQQQKSLSTQLAPQDIQQFVSQAAESLQHAHDKNILHLGIKQTNFLVRYQTDGKRFPHLELADFSIARFTALPANLASGQGASYALAPELLRGHPVAATDQYELAALVYELLTGHVYTQDGKGGRGAPALFSPEEQAAKLSPVVSQVLQRALLLDPTARYASITEFAEAFEHAMRQGEHGEHIYVMLGISEAEALSGVSYPLAMADKRLVTVNVPPNVHAGQILRIPNAGQASQFGGPRGQLVVTLAVRPDPNENLRLIEQLEHLSESIQTLQVQPMELGQQMQALDRKVMSALEPEEDEVKFRGLQDIPRYISKHIPPGIAVALSVLLLVVICGNCLLCTTLKGDIVGNGSGNIALITTTDEHMTATASAHTNALATATVVAQATATAKQTVALQAAADAQLIPQQYAVTSTGSTSILIFNDLTAQSNIGQWTAQKPATGQSCGFVETTDKFYHAQMPSSGSTPLFCQTTGSQGTVSTGPTFVLQTQMTIIDGDVGGVAFGIHGKSFCYFYINQLGQYEIGLNGVPFSTGKGQSDAINKGTGSQVSNLLAVVANNKKLTFYVNLQPIFSIDDVQLPAQGQLALVAQSNGSPTDVAYQSIKVWRY